MKLIVSNIVFWLIFALGFQSFAQNNKKATNTRPDAVSEHRVGVASFYHPKFEGRKTATGDIFDNDLYTCASNFYPLGTYLKVTNLANGKVIYVVVNDRMGHQTRVIDLTELAARDLNFYKRGTTKVKLERVSKVEGKNQILAQNNSKSKNSESQGRNQL